jgi:hypothetical protein
MTSIALTALFVLLQVADVWTTYKCITSGKGKEANPVMKWIMDKLGLLEGLVLLKIVGTVVVVGLLSQFIEALILLNCFYSYIVYNNWKILNKC